MRAPPFFHLGFNDPLRMDGASFGQTDVRVALWHRGLCLLDPKQVASARSSPRWLAMVSARAAGRVT